MHVVTDWAGIGSWFRYHRCSLHSGFWQVRFVPRSNLMAALSDTVFTSLFANESAARAARISSFTLPRSKLPAFVLSTKETA